jgi:hypothetical protein
MPFKPSDLRLHMPVRCIESIAKLLAGETYQITSYQVESRSGFGFDEHSILLKVYGHDTWFSDRFFEKADL